MKKLIKWFEDWWLFASSLLLLAFIPLYPKLPLLDIKNTWVYVRVEDFLVLFVILGLGIASFRSRLTIKSPVTVPILLFWLAGAVATIHSILLIVPVVWDIFPNVAFLSMLRRIEYMSLFFVAYLSVRDKRHTLPVVVTVVLTVFAVSVYGLGQKYFGLPAYLTMNEEFAKGVPLTLSALSRVSSTFGGHYDLAAFLVLTMPIVASLIFAARNLLVKGILGIVFLLGFFVLFMTVSRISVFALFLSLGLVLFFQRRKLVLLLLPIGVIGVFLLTLFAPSLVDRFSSTIKSVDVLVDAKTGHPIGHIKTVPSSYFENKVVRQYFYDSISDVTSQASPSAKYVIPASALGENVILLTEPTAPTGEDLPSGTGYINLTLSPNIKRVGEFLYEPDTENSTGSAEAYVINGQYVIKDAAAYDLSFTTRFQGEWPHAIAAFKRNVFFGSGYGSVSLAVDNSYLRMLAEVGILGFVTFVAIFLMFAIYIARALPLVENRMIRSFVWGVAAGIVGLSVNALFIDVFEASKVAFVLWLLVGFSLGLLRMTARTTVEVFSELKRLATSHVAIAAYLGVAILLIWSPLSRNYFIGDDFTWLRWAADGTGISSVMRYIFEAEGFFYRPATKIYFAFMYKTFWLNQAVYHTVSLVLHFFVSFLVYILGRRVFRSLPLACMGAFVFVFLSGFSEAVFWIAATGHMFATFFMVSGMLLYGMWSEKRNRYALAAAMASLVLALGFHEMAVVTPLLFWAYDRFLTGNKESMFYWFRSRWALLIPIPVYGLMRYVAGSHWLSGDYNFNLIKLPLNMAGNAIGYTLVAMIGQYGETFYHMLRSILRANMGVAVILLVFSAAAIHAFVRMMRRMDGEDRQTLDFSLSFAFVSLLPFLGLGNMASRYGYTAAVGLSLLAVLVFSKLYTALRVNGDLIAKLILSILLSVFVLFHSVMLHQIHQDWNQAGDMVKRFVISMDGAYVDEWATKTLELNLVNMPIRHGQAWVFPVGVVDALWFVFRNPNVYVNTYASTSEALRRVSYDNPLQRVFLFADDGSVVEVPKPIPVLP